MGQYDRAGAANLHGLARVEREKRWTGIMDAALAFSVLLWIVGLAGSGILPSVVSWALPGVIGLMLLHRVLVGVERHHRRRTDLAVRRPTEDATRQDARAA